MLAERTGYDALRALYPDYKKVAILSVNTSGLLAQEVTASQAEVNFLLEAFMEYATVGCGERLQTCDAEIIFSGLTGIARDFCRTDLEQIGLKLSKQTIAAFIADFLHFVNHTEGYHCKPIVIGTLLPDQT